MPYYYAGIGARKTPENVLDFMFKISDYLEQRNVILRSGGADGADSAFENGCNNEYMMDIYLPWKGYNGNTSSLYNISSEALNMASKFHPNWGNLSQGVKKLMARNCYQILGEDLNTLSDFVVCWTPNGKVTGGTGQALRIAKYYNIPIVNLGGQSFEEAKKQILALIGE